VRFKPAVFFLAVLLWLLSPPAHAQLLSVTGDYRVTQLDPQHQRFGVAILKDDPHVTQNWVYVQPSTEIHYRLTSPGGWSKQESMNYYQFFAQAHVGNVVRIRGGRRWDGGISCKTLFIGDFFQRSARARS
jgi:hypothetical protein